MSLKLVKETPAREKELEALIHLLSREIDKGREDIAASRRRCSFGGLKQQEERIDYYAELKSKYESELSRITK